MTLSPAATSASIDANRGVSRRTRAAREQFPTRSQMIVGRFGSYRRRAAKSSSFDRRTARRHHDPAPWRPSAGRDSSIAGIPTRGDDEQPVRCTAHARTLGMRIYPAEKPYRFSDLKLVVEFLHRFLLRPGLHSRIFCYPEH